MISAFIAGQGFAEAVLPVVDVADVDIEPGQPPGISFRGEDLPRTFAAANARLYSPRRSMGWMDPLKVRATSSNLPTASNRATACS